jgi:copper transport protein
MMSTHWGHALLLQHAAGAVALIAFLLARRGHASGWLLATGASLVLVVTPALAGHAIAAPRFTTLSVVLDALHVLGASGWLGSLFLLVAAGVPAIERMGDERWSDIAALVEAFSPVALACAALVVGTGVVAAWLRLGSLHALFTTLYGQVLIAKLVVLSGVVATGAYNWLRVRPKLGTAGATVTLRRSARTELAIGVIVVVITAVLVATPTPRIANAGALNAPAKPNAHTT